MVLFFLIYNVYCITMVCDILDKSYGSCTLVVVPGQSGRGLAEEKTVILFIEKTWFLWWTLVIIVTARWFHVLSVDAKIKASHALVSEKELEQEEEKAYVVSWQILKHAQVISLSGTKRAA